MTPAAQAHHADGEDGEDLGRGAAKTVFAHDPLPASALSYGTDYDDNDLYCDCWNGRNANGHSWQNVFPSVGRQWDPGAQVPAGEETHREPGGRSHARPLGKWDGRLMGSFISDGEEYLMWEMKPIKRDPENRYLLNDFGLSLNEICQTIKGKLPSTNSRFRPDQLLGERELFDDAHKEINWLEEKQRKVRKENAKNGIKYKTKWFSINEGSNPKNWKMEDGAEYLGVYWGTRETGDWGPLRDIYT